MSPQQDFHDDNRVYHGDKLISTMTLIFHDDNPTRETCLREDSAMLCRLHMDTFFERDVHGYSNQGLITQAVCALHPLGHRHTVDYVLKASLRMVKALMLVKAPMPNVGPI
jgi:hypothetical protein